MPDRSPVTAEAAAGLLKQACGRLAEHLHLVEPQPGTWYLLFNGGGAYRAEWSEAWARLVLTADLGFPTEGAERHALNLALTYNALWREVGPLRMARDGENGELVLIGELDLAERDAHSLDSALLHFEGLRRRWAHALLHAADRAGEAPLAPPLLERLVDRV